jgi:hypothetical protein
MPTTPRLALRYPALTDAPNGPVAVQNLGLDVESWLNRAFPCTSTSRPASPAQGMIIYETDTGEWRGWTGAAWEEIGGATGGGGAAPVTADAQYSANGSQTISSGGAGTVVAFGAAQQTTPYVERQTFGVGHQFKLTVSGLWAISTAIRCADENEDGELSSGLYSTANPHNGPTPEPLAFASGGDESGGVTFTWALTRRFAANALLYVAVRNLTGSNRALERGVNGATVRINFALVGR